MPLLNATCTCNKNCYSKQEAQQARNAQRSRGKARDLEIYQCSGYCWHLSHRKFTGFDRRGKRFKK